MKLQPRTEPTKPVYGIVDNRSTRRDHVANFEQHASSPISGHLAEENRMRSDKQDADDGRCSYGTVRGNAHVASGWEQGQSKYKAHNCLTENNVKYPTGFLPWELGASLTCVATGSLAGDDINSRHFGISRNATDSRPSLPHFRGLVLSHIPTISSQPLAPVTPECPLEPRPAAPEPKVLTRNGRTYHLSQKLVRARQPVVFLATMTATTALREALNQDISSGDFIDTKIVLCSHRDTHGRVCRPKPLRTNSHVLKTVPYFNDCEHTPHTRYRSPEA